VYNMYSWDQPAGSEDEHAEQPGAHAGTKATTGTKAPAGNTSQPSNGRHAAPTSAPASTSAPETATAARDAVQVSLDRRDNGGDADPRHAR
jgi:hypothetical protein